MSFLIRDGGLFGGVRGFDRWTEGLGCHSCLA